MNVNDSPAVVIRSGYTSKENLPLPYVLYPGHYGVFIAFAESPNCTAYLCDCSKGAVGNYISFQLATTLKSSWEYDNNKNIPPQNSLINSRDFPLQVSKAMLNTIKRQDYSVFNELKFRPGLCHRCNMIAPSQYYCHTMYGTKFIQQYGWYVNQNYYRLGIYLKDGFSLYNTDTCPNEMKPIVDKILSCNLKIDQLNERDDRDSICVTDPLSELSDLVRAQLKILNTEIENTTRQEFGVKKVGERWVSETILYQIIQNIFPNREIIRHYRPNWLEGLELDIFIPDENIAFEYQGQQHYFPIKIWGGEKALSELKQRDARKKSICEKLGLFLYQIKYTEPLTEQNIRSIIHKNIDKLFIVNIK